MNDRVTFEEELLVESLALPSEARRAFVEQRCGTDNATADRLFALIAGYQENSAFLETSAPAAALQSTGRVFAAIPPEPEPGDRISHYHLLKRIGEGGFGVVYLAEQEEPMRRLVALKVIRLGLDTREFIARFEAERQALAVMDHPNIARVFDAGATDNGRPYLVMELIRGTPITSYCDEHNLSVPARLGLFLQVCGAIQHAHQKGIIHCDLKPSNILIELHDPPDGGCPKVIDFGIAKATPDRRINKTLFTHFHALIGTPAYTSPEQMELSGLDVDTRSDIYSLGVLLYELLTGHQPFDPEILENTSLEEMRRLIREVDPPRPSLRVDALEPDERIQAALRRGLAPEKLQPLLRSDLDWIVMRCLEKDRTRRYETANGLAMDLRRYLENEPVVARPPSRTYKFQKFVTRNRTWVIAGTTIAMALVAGLTLASVGLARARVQRHATEAARRDAEDLVSFMVKDLKPELQRAGRSPLTAQVAERAVAYFKNLPPDLNNASTERNRATALEALAYVRSFAGKTEAAVTLWHEAFAARRRAAADAPNDALLAVELALTEFVDVSRGWPLVLSAAPGSPESPETDARLSTIVKQARQFYQSHSDKREVARIFAQLLYNDSQYLGANTSRPEEALGIGREAEKLYRDFLARSPEDTTLGSEFVHLLESVAASAQQAGHAEVGIQVAEEALTFADRAVEKNPGNTELREDAAAAAMQLSFRLGTEVQEKVLAAEAIARERWRALLQTDPANFRYRHDFAWAHFWESFFLSRSPRKAEAFQATEKFLTLLSPVAQAPNDFLTLRLTAFTLSGLEADLGDAEGMRKHFDQAREWHGKYIASLTPDLARQPSVQILYWDDECFALDLLGDWPGLEQNARTELEAIRNARRLNPQPSTFFCERLHAIFSLGRALVRQGAGAKAIPVLQGTVLELADPEARRLLGQECDGVILLLNDLIGEALVATGDVQQARPLLEKNLTEWEKIVATKGNVCGHIVELAGNAVLLASTLNPSDPREAERRAALLDRASTQLENRPPGATLSRDDTEWLAKIKTLRAEFRETPNVTATVVSHGGGTP